MNNNGACSSYVTYSPEDGTPRELCTSRGHITWCMSTTVLTKPGLLVKLPFAPVVNGSLFFRHSFPDRCTTCLISTVDPDRFDRRLREVFCSRPDIESNKSAPPDPFILLSLLLDHFSMQMEGQRGVMDNHICKQEARFKHEVYGSFQKIGLAKAEEYAQAKGLLHKTEQSMVIMERCLEFQVELANFLLAQHAQLAGLERQHSSVGSGIGTDISQFSRVDTSLSLSTSLSHSRLEQVRVMSKRIQIQLKVVSL